MQPADTAISAKATTYSPPVHEALFGQQTFDQSARRVTLVIRIMAGFGSIIRPLSGIDYGASSAHWHGRPHAHRWAVSQANMAKSDGRFSV